MTSCRQSDTLYHTDLWLCGDGIGKRKIYNIDGDAALEVTTEETMLYPGAVLVTADSAEDALRAGLNSAIYARFGHGIRPFAGAGAAWARYLHSPSAERLPRSRSTPVSRGYDVDRISERRGP